MTPVDPRQSVEFEPVKLGGRRRRIDPTVIGVALVIVGVALGILKPWGSGDGDASRVVADASAIPSSLTEAGASTLPTDPPPPAVQVIAGPAPLAWADVAAAIRPHDEWGIRAILDTPGRTRSGTRTTLDERWRPVTVAATDPPRAVLQFGDRSMVGLGVTFPIGQAPLDVRIWRRAASGALYWLDARPIGSLPGQGGLIFAPPTTDPSSPAWGAGLYRIDLLLDRGTIQRMEIAIPDRYENVRPSSAVPALVTELVPSSQVDPAGVAVGPFATIDRIGLPLESVGGPPLDAAGAWLDTEPGSGRIPADRVAVAHLPRATGLGVRLPDGSVVRAASIERLAPGPMFASTVGGGVIDRRTTDPWVLFAARRGEPWAPGVYRIEAAWDDADGRHEAAWHIELRPGAETGTTPLLGIARAWARHAGAPGLVVGRAEPLEGGPRGSVIRRLDLVDEYRPFDGRPAELGCQGTVVNGTTMAFGLAHPIDDPWTVTRVGWVDASLRGMGDLVTVQATDVVPGLTLIAPTDGASFLPGIYRIGIQDRQGPRTVTLCVGLAGTAGG